MKVNEYFKLLENFDHMWADNRLTVKGKISIGREFVNSLPPVQMVRSTIHIRNFLVEYFVNTINGAADAEEAKQGKVETSSGSKVDGKKSAQAPKQTSKGKRRS